MSIVMPANSTCSAISYEVEAWITFHKGIFWNQATCKALWQLCDC